MKRHLRPKHKYVLLPAVSVHIYECDKVILCYNWTDIFTGISPQKVLSKLLSGPNRRVQPVVWLIVSAVEITSGHRCSVISNNHTIRVQHGNDFKDDSFPELF